MLQLLRQIAIAKQLKHWERDLPIFCSFSIEASAMAARGRQVWCNPLPASQTPPQLGSE